MAYTEPNVLIHQILEPAAVATPREQPAHIAAGYAHLGRYSDADEKTGIELGYYDDGQEVCQAWPGIPAGGVPDLSYTKLFVDDALLRYFTSSLNLSTVDGANNEIRSSDLVFKGNGAEYPLSGIFLDRDVKVGDIVRVRAVVDDEESVLWSYVAGFKADQTASDVDTLLYDADNQAAEADPPGEFSKTGGDDNCVDITEIDSSSYEGRPDGDITETYRIRVMEASVGGDATTARLAVTSASGHDDQAVVTPAAFGAPTSIGTRGLTVTWDLAEDGCSSSALEDEIAPNDFVVGQEWTVECGQTFTAATAASGGTYTGDVDTTYVVEVTRGGVFGSGDPAQITCTTITGGDFSGPTNVPTAGTYAVGTSGVTIQFTGAGLCGGDIYYISVSAAEDGNHRTILLGNNLPEEVLDNGATSVSLSLYMRKNIQVPRLREGDESSENWSQVEEQVCIQPGITVYDDEWMSAGDHVALPLFSSETLGYGRMYLEYRAWLPDFCNGVHTLETIGDIDTVIPGPLTPDNPLKYGVYWAKALSAGVPVRFTGICDPNDTDSWLQALDYMENRRDIYGLVPVTRSAEVQLAWYGHANEQSSASIGCRRVVWFNQALPTTGVVSDASNSSDNDPLLAVVEDDDEVAGTQYTIVRIPAGNGQFVTNGVRAGDVVRLLYSEDAYGNEVYTERIVDEVINQDTLRITIDLGAPVNVARRIEVWRNLNADDQVERAISAKAFDDRRVQVVLPDSFQLGSETIDGLFLTCGLAGLASGVEPHQSLTRYPINGVTSVPVMDKFKRSQLNQLADAGFWLVVEDKQSGTVWTRHALTAVTRDDANYREEAITRNLDNISLQTYDQLLPFLGVANNVETTRTFIRTRLFGLYQAMQTRITNALLGPQLVELRELTVLPHPILKNNVEITTRMSLPYAVNEIVDYLII